MRATERVKEVKRWGAETDRGNCGYLGVSSRAAVTMLCLLLASHSPLSPQTLLPLLHASRESSIASAKDPCFCFSSWQLIWIIYISFTLKVADCPLPNDSELGDAQYLFIKVTLTGCFFLVAVGFLLLHVFSSLVRVKRFLYHRSGSRQLHNFPLLAFVDGIILLTAVAKITQSLLFYPKASQLPATRDSFFPNFIKKR